jgi:5'-nucleotidase
VTPHILITNDDGIDSPGLTALEHALSKLASVTIVAPDREMSATSHRITLDRRLPHHRVAPNRYAVEEGTPADCVIVASDILDSKPALVVSGVNRGHNVADDVSYSGTVAAASEAILQGIPAIAVSTYGCENPNFAAAAGVALFLAKRILEHGLPQDVMLNVNYPKEWNGLVRWTRQGRRGSHRDLEASRRPKSGKNHQPPETPMSDIAAVAEGYVSVSPLHLDRTAHAHFVRFAGWFDDLPPVK